MNKILFLAIDPAMIFVCFIGVVLTIIITRMIFSIPSLLKHQKAQTALLAKIAEKSGVDSKDVHAIVVETTTSLLNP